MTFGEKLQELRKATGMSQPALAQASGLPVGSIRGYEQGHREPIWDVVFKLAGALGVDCREFAECVEKPAGNSAASKPVTPPTPGKRPAAKPGKRERLEGGAQAVNDVGKPTKRKGTK